MDDNAMREWEAARDRADDDGPIVGRVSDEEYADAVDEFEAWLARHDAPEVRPEGASYDPPSLGVPLRARTWPTLADALLDVAEAEEMALLADITIGYDGARCTFTTRIYETPVGWHVPGPLGVDPASGEIVETTR